MEALIEICCGVDLHKDSIMACVLSGKADEGVEVHTKSTGTMHDQLLDLAEWLKSLNCHHVAMESTGCYWQPLYHVLTEAGIACAVVNARYAKNLPGRKTDWNDAQWIAHLHRCGLLRASYVPNEEQQSLRNYTRTLESLTQDRTREMNRIEKLLQATGFKLSSVMSDIFCDTGLSFLQLLAERGRITLKDVQRLRDPRCKHTAEEMARALQGKLRSEDARLLAFKLRQIDAYNAQISELESMINEMITPYADAIKIVDSIPGIGEQAAVQIVGEIGVNMSQFSSGEQLAAWAGLSPGSNESAGKKSPHASSMETATSSEC